MRGKLTSSPATVGPSPENVTFRGRSGGVSMPEPRIFEDIFYAGRLKSKRHPGIIFGLSLICLTWEVRLRMEFRSSMVRDFTTMGGAVVEVDEAIVEVFRGRR